jgi:nitrite reductase/ring-hydroxylating ferredoxin subunit
MSAAKFHAVTAVSTVPVNGVRAMKAGETRIALYNVGGRFYATDLFCTHARVSLAGGYIDNDIIECALHGGAFHIPTGKAVTQPCTQDLQVYDVKVENDTVYVAVPEATP